MSMMDLGGGPHLFSVACAAAGMSRSVVADDFRDDAMSEYGDSTLGAHAQYGVQTTSRDIMLKGMEDIDGQFDAITSFDSMEHWRNSPKNYFIMQ